MNPVIMLTTLNSTINCMVDVMEKMLSSTAITTAPAALPTTNATDISSTVTSPSQSAQPLPNPLLASPQEILNQAMKITTSDGTLTKDQLLAASLFFTSATESAVHTAHTFIALNNNQVVQRCFLLHLLEAAALLPGKGKGKVVEDGDNSMSY